MIQSTVTKTYQNDQITPEQLEKIRKYTRRSIPPENLFVFSLLLCDNEIDRDFERFPKQSLESLAKLYLGKTGVFDHHAKAENQSARIFDTQVIANGNNTLGEEYCALQAWAYMVRCNKNADLILEIDAGIKKEVSVGCAVGKVCCSVCGQNLREKACNHKKGNSYSGAVCYHELLEPTDAYEWSFVAVPAQKNAGVTKRYGAAENGESVFARLEKASGSMTLDHSEVAMLKAHLQQLTELSKAGARYRDQLCEEVVRAASKAVPLTDCGLLEEICGLLNLEQLEKLQKNYQTIAQKRVPVVPQLAQARPEQPATSYSI